MGFSEKPGLSENGLYLRTRLFTKEHPCSQDCIRTSDDLKMRLEKPILFARAYKDRFQINRVFLKKPTLSADNVGFFQRDLLYLRKPILSDHMMSFSEKPTLSERNPHYLQIMWGFFSEKPTLFERNPYCLIRKCEFLR